MRYITESLAEALYNARKNRFNTEAPEPVSESTEEITEGEDFNDVDDEESKTDNLAEVEDALDLDEARWVTMSGNHALVGDKGELLKGGDPEKRKKVSRKEVEDAVKDANSKSKSVRK